ncbi:MAG: phosphodiester glycosidase family protein [Aggregatilineales bacterium]
MTQAATLSLIICIIGWSVVLWRFIKSRQKRYLLLIIPLLLVTIPVSAAFWYTHRDRPNSEMRLLFDGITYHRDVRNDPRPMIAHIITVDLTNPRIQFLVTPTNNIEGFALPARTTSQFLDDFGLQIAINGDFFDPWRDYGPWDYYPHSGDGVNTRGLSASIGTIYTRGFMNGNAYSTLYISADNRVSFNEPVGAVYNAISGYLTIVRDGALNISPNRDVAYKTTPHPRTVVALNQAGTELIFVLVDGRQPNYSEGATLYEVAQIVIDYGGYTALNLDGGGSVTLAMQSEDGTSELLNSPVHGRIPGRERPIANHLGVYAPRLQE